MLRSFKTKWKKCVHTILSLHSYYYRPNISPYFTKHKKKRRGEHDHDDGDGEGDQDFLERKILQHLKHLAIFFISFLYLL